MLKLMETRVNRFPEVEFPRNVKVLIHNPYTALTCRCKCTHWQPLSQRQLSLQRCVDKANTMINSAEEGLKVRFAQQELQERTDVAARTISAMEQEERLVRPAVELFREEEKILRKRNSSDKQKC